jgi:hypothetical protein
MHLCQASMAKARGDISKVKNLYFLIAYLMILKENNHVMMLARRKILKILQMKVKNLERLLIALI